MRIQNIFIEENKFSLHIFKYIFESVSCVMKIFLIIFLGATVNNKIAIDGVGGEVLKDALQVLSCNEIRLTSLRSHADEEPPTDANEAAAALFTTAKKTIISHVIIITYIYFLKKLM